MDEEDSGKDSRVAWPGQGSHGPSVYGAEPTLYVSFPLCQVCMRKMSQESGLDGHEMVFL